MPSLTNYRSMTADLFLRPRIAPAVGVLSRRLKFSSTDEGFENDGIGHVDATVHSFVVKATEIALVLPRAALFVADRAARFHARFRAVYDFSVDGMFFFYVAQSETLTLLFVRIPSPDIATAGLITSLLNFAVRSNGDVLSLPFFWRLV